jgi:iron complex outermembrane recepter protein
VNIVTKNSRDTSGLFMQVGTGNEDPADAEVRYGGHVGAATYRAYAKFIERASQRYSTGISAGDRRQRGQVGARFDGGDQSRGAWMVKRRFLSQCRRTTRPAKR